MAIVVGMVVHSCKNSKMLVGYDNRMTVVV